MADMHLFYGHANSNSKEVRRSWTTFWEISVKYSLQALKETDKIKCCIRNSGGGEIVACKGGFSWDAEMTLTFVHKLHTVIPANN
jgi:hypothetical protein